MLNTISQARAPSTRRLYALKLSVFSTWCTTRGANPVVCDISLILLPARAVGKGSLPFHTQGLCSSYSSLTCSYRWPISGQEQPGCSFWVLSLSLSALKSPPFEPLQSATTLASVKLMRDLQALSVSPSWCEFGPNDSKIVLKPRHGYIPKVLSTPIRAQVITLSALPPSEQDQCLNLLCPVRALRIYIECSALFRQSEQSFVCFGGRTKGSPVTKQRLSRRISYAITLA